MKKLGVAILGSIILIAVTSLTFAQNFSAKVEPSKNVSVVDGKQIIEIVSEGGYFPRLTVARADVPSVIKVKTVGSFDCGLAFTIPSLNYRKMLPVSGETLIEVPAQSPGSRIQGLCSMAMYRFSISFE